MSESYVQAAAELARIAGDNAMRFFGKALDVESKMDGSPVTEADRSTETLAREWIARRFPGDGILGEEFGSSRPDAARQWIIDPIDGTKSFVRGVPLWGTLVAVMEGESVLAGAAFFPAIGEMIVAGAGEGCWWNSKRCAVSTVAELHAATVLTSEVRFDSAASSHLDGWRSLTEKAAVSRTWGDCYGYLLVATGRAEVMVDPILSVWDIAPFVCVIPEAGGVLTDLAGNVSAFGGSAIATNAALAHTARAMLGVPETGRDAAVSATPRQRSGE
jgi:histidinol-phosphate phosphatase HisN, inositol monophosphatase family